MPEKMIFRVCKNQQMTLAIILLLVRLAGWLPTVEVKAGIQNNRIAIQLELAVAIRFFGRLNKPVSERTRPCIFVQKIMENRVDVKPITPCMRKWLE